MLVSGSGLVAMYVDVSCIDGVEVGGPVTGNEQFIHYDHAHLWDMCVLDFSLY